MSEFVGIKKFNSFVDAEEPIQELEITFGIHVTAKDYPAFQEKFLSELQTFLDERK